MPKRRWTDDELAVAVAMSNSFRSVIIKLGLVPAGGNYQQVQRRVHELKVNTGHFTGKGWNTNLAFRPVATIPLSEILVLGSYAQSNKLKKRLFRVGALKPVCTLCGWAEISPDGRIPLELDHFNGNNQDNRLENLRILCPNCHSLQLTHRGLNKKSIRAVTKLSPGGEIGKHS